MDAALDQIGRGVRPAGSQAFDDRAGLAEAAFVLLGIDGFDMSFTSRTLVAGTWLKMFR